MIRNSNPYGQSEVPVNMGPPITVPKINAPIGTTNNLSKYTNYGAHSSNSHYGHQDHSNLIPNGIHMNHFPPYSRNLPYNIDPYQSMPSQSNLNISQYPNVIPSNVNYFQNNFDLMQYHIPNPITRPSLGFSNEFIAETDRKCGPINIPKNALKSTETIENVEDSTTVSLQCPKSVPNNVDDKMAEEPMEVTEDSKETLIPITEKAVVKAEEPSEIEEVAVDCSTKEVNTAPKVEENMSGSEHSNSNDMCDYKEEFNYDREDRNENIDSTIDMTQYLRDTHGIIKECMELKKYTVLGIDKAEDIVKNGEQPDLGCTQTAFECPVCSLVFLHPKRYLIHTKWHTFGQRSDKKFIKETIKMEKLEQKKLEKEKKIMEREGCIFCPQCNKPFINKKSLNNHRQRYHKSLLKECKICRMSFMNWKMLRSHVANAHMSDCTYTCSQCPKTFKFPRSLQKHEDTHLEKTHPCSQCDKKFGSELLLSIHVKTHEKFLKGATYHCTYCAKGFYDSYTLAAHERTHRNEKPFQCEICQTSFGTTSGLKRHLKVSHSTSKLFECSICHRSFSTEAIRDRHEIRAHGDPYQLKYPCQFCTSRFITAKDLRKHCNKMHSKTKRRRRAKDLDDDD